MFITPIIILVVVAILLISFYNSLKVLEVRISASLQEIGNQLKRQVELIPNLVDSVKGYLKHEKGIFEELTSARKGVEAAVKSGSANKIDEAQSLINKALSSLKVVVESNPEIKSAELVGSLMDELRDTSDKVMYARRTLIDLTADYNVKVTTIPGVWLASLFGFSQKPGLSTPTTGTHLTVSDSDTQTPKVNL